MKFLNEEGADIEASSGVVKPVSSACAGVVLRAHLISVYLAFISTLVVPAKNKSVSDFYFAEGLSKLRTAPY